MLQVQSHAPDQLTLSLVLLAKRSPSGSRLFFIHSRHMTYRVVPSVNLAMSTFLSKRVMTYGICLPGKREGEGEEGG